MARHFDGPFGPLSVGLDGHIHTAMRNENNSQWLRRASLLRNSVPPQAPVARLPHKKLQNRWKAPITAEYLQALREADELVFQAILRGATMRHSARVLKA
jgi:hypothetical protein